MSIAARFRHEIVISRYGETGTVNARGNLTRGYVADAESVMGNVQEHKAREVPTGELDGVTLSDAIAFLPIATATSSLRAPDRLLRASLIYELVGLPRDAGGRGRHLKADLRRVTA